MDETLRNLAPLICGLFVALAGHLYARRLGRQAMKARELRHPPVSRRSKPVPRPPPVGAEN